MNSVAIHGFVILLVLFCNPAMAQVYKWVDGDGVVHYGDESPEGVEAELVQIDPSPPPQSNEAVSELLQRAEENSIRRAGERQTRSDANQARQKETLAQQQRCTHLRKQLHALQQQLPVYRDEDGAYRNVWEFDVYEGKRVYLDDSTRAAEIERVRRDMNNVCERPEHRGEQNLAGWDRYTSNRCEDARAKLKSVSEASVRSPRQTIEDVQREVDMYCKAR